MVLGRRIAVEVRSGPKFDTRPIGSGPAANRGSGQKRSPLCTHVIWRQLCLGSRDRGNRFISSHHEREYPQERMARAKSRAKSATSSSVVSQEHIQRTTDASSSHV